MPSEPRIYTRLTRNTSGLGTMASLWLADDHLMIVRSTGYTEDYARLLLRDIKGFFVTPSERRLWWGVTWAIVAASSGSVLASSEIPVVSPFFLALALVMFIWNHLLGPGCRVHVVTGVQTAELPALVRMRKARRVLDRLQPMIEAAQAGLGGSPVAPPGPPPAFQAP